VSAGARVKWILVGRTRQRRTRIFGALCKAYRWAFVVPLVQGHFLPKCHKQTRFSNRSIFWSLSSWSVSHDSPRIRANSRRYSVSV